MKQIAMPMKDVHKYQSCTKDQIKTSCKERVVCGAQFSSPRSFVNCKENSKSTKRNMQQALLGREKLEYGGELLKTRKGRMRGRPIDTKNTMHLVLRSSKAVGVHSMKRRPAAMMIDGVLKKFAQRFGVVICSYANNGNHLHLHLKIRNRYTYKPFIRAISSSIAMSMSGVSRWRPSHFDGRFWDFRPYTRVVVGVRDFLNVANYVALNRLESVGYSRVQGRFIIASRAFRVERLL